MGPPTKRAVVGRATRGQGAPQIGIAEPGADIAQNGWGEAKFAIVNEFVRSPAEAETLAQAALDEMASAFVEAEGTCFPNAEILPGRQVQIDGVGERFNGTYYVTQVIHEWAADTGMVTHFIVSGRRDRGLWSMVQDSKPRAPGIHGVVIGIVTNNKDPDELGRVRVKFPWLSEQDEARGRGFATMAGNGRGFSSCRRWTMKCSWRSSMATFIVPLWSARYGTARTRRRCRQVRQSAETARSINASGNRTPVIPILLDDSSGGEEITIVDKTGNNKIVFHSPDNSMQIKVQGDLTIEAQGKITLKAMTGVEMSSQANFSIKGNTAVEVSSQTQLSLSGQASADSAAPR